VSPWFVAHLVNQAINTNSTCTPDKHSLISFSCMLSCLDNFINVKRL